MRRLLFALGLLLWASVAQAQITVTNPSGGTTTPAVIAGEITIATASAPASVNFSTEGTIDWFYAGTIATTPRLQSIPVYSKLLGEQMYQLFDWVDPGTMWAYAGWTPLVSTTAGDSTGPALTNSNTGTGIYRNEVGAVNYGVRFGALARTTTRVLRLYVGVFSGIATITARLSDGSHADVTATIEATAGVSADKMVTITYNSSEDFARLSVSVLITTNRGSSPNIHLMGATLGSS